MLHASCVKHYRLFYDFDQIYPSRAFVVIRSNLPDQCMFTIEMLNVFS